MACSCGLQIFLSIVLVLLAAVVFFVKRRYTYWTSRGVLQVEPVKFFIGNFQAKISLAYQFADMYKQIKSRGEKYGGAYFFLSPTFIPVDVDLIKTIMVKDFNHFMNHDSDFVNENDPLSTHVFNLLGDQWKTVRTKLTPTFTSGRIKMMFETIMDCTQELKLVLNEYSVTNDPLDVKEILARFTTDVIGNCAFGLECNTMKDPDSEFRKYGKKIVELPTFKRYRFLFLRLLPKFIFNFFRFKFTERDVEDFFLSIVKDTVDYRAKNNVFRKDFMHLMIQLKNRGKLVDDENLTHSANDENAGDSFLSMTEISAQCFIFFVAGFETSSTTMSFGLYELCLHQEIQDKLRNEINTVLSKSGDKFTYDAITEMTYMDQVVRETLRKYPPLGAIPRECNKNYTIPGTDIVIEKGTRLQIPVLGIHMDPEYYPDPEKFDPDRFTEENKAKRPAFSWLPFGEGPRICIGMRFGLLQTKIGIATILRSHRVTLSQKTKIPLVINPNAFLTTCEGPIYINVEKI